ncbi:hypothetical protein VP1G_10168 [Cytospora mali]|uniref:HNH nuclease domain-containing protein n=1 Tax=Cytospora mali TaxID=578113 RepID=A0A194VGA0_CYTMA|nr:hypothetical protein VP1G_10168 [Valsa mali var. pyri (nom. inval.)]
MAEAPVVHAEPPTSMVSTTSTIPLAPPPRPIQQRCVLSNNSWSVHKSHLVSSAQATWFQANSMRRYGDGQRFINDDRNILPMRHDLHTLWDAHIFALVPKQGEFVAHVLTIPKPAVGEFASEWHNMPVQMGALDGVGKAYIFAKFAQAMFMLLKPFVAYSPGSRYVARLQATADERQEYRVQKEWISGRTLCDLYSGGGSRSASATSRKRSHSLASGAAEELGNGEGSRMTVILALKKTRFKYHQSLTTGLGQTSTPRMGVWQIRPEIRNLYENA